jgi:hypothetical protein
LWGRFDKYLFDLPNIWRTRPLLRFLKYFLKRLPGVVGSKPGSSRFFLFSHFHHFTAEPQRLPDFRNILTKLMANKKIYCSNGSLSKTWVNLW